LVDFPPSCTEEGGTPHPMNSLADFDQLVQGTWLMCDYQGSSFGPTDAVGVNIDSNLNFTWALNSPGGLTFIPGGNITALFFAGAPNAVDANFNTPCGTYDALPQFEDSPRQMNIEGTGGSWRLIAASEGEADGGNAVLPGAGRSCLAGGGPPLCASPPVSCSLAQGTALAAPPTPSAMQALLDDTWFACGPPGNIGPAGNIGVQIAANGQFFFLLEAADGGSVRATSLDGQGNISYANGGQQVDLNLLTGGTYDFFPEFSAGPKRMLLDNNGVSTVVYASAELDDGGPAPLPTLCPP
jgi:hypothetical protein